MKLVRLLAALLAALAASPLLAADDMPALVPLAAADIPQECGCSFGAKKDQTLMFWSWEKDKQYARIRERGAGLRELRLYEEKYFPAQHEPPRMGDRMTLLFSWSNWNVQTASQVSTVCAPRAKRCSETGYRNLLLLQWKGQQRTELRGWARCGCPVR